MLLPAALLLFSLAFWSPLIAQNDDAMQQARRLMVKRQLAARGVDHPGVLRAMRTVPRHRFVPEDMRAMAYADQPLPIGHGQTISQPYIVAYMTQVIDPKKDDVVLEIGTGTGYQAAVLSPLVEHVYTVEIISELAERARKRLSTLGYRNVTVRHGDGYHGWKEHGPYDAIVVTAASEHIPPPLVEQLKEGGSMIIPVGSPFRTQYLMLVEKRNGEVRTRTLMPVRFVPFTRDN
ncbi:MAG: protein-L-isoaspartate(D-aspartate) O-methyltransferase [Bacteroidetes bacterium]|nr:protein-L-isoaspartate(D-aspartate) O-methyltransferase [Bacteroidota bacterium]